MKKIPFIFLFALISLTNVAGQSNFVSIQFINSINGFHVSADWLPQKITYEHIVGPAIIKFTNIANNESFLLSNDHFSILKANLPFDYTNDGIIMINGNKTINLSYPNIRLQDNGTFGTTDVPFFFQDLNFDEKKELIITEVGNGQRGWASFKVYQLSYGSIQSDLYNITYEEPYRHLDDVSRFYKSKKQIILYGSGGVCTSTHKFYNFIPPKGELQKGKYALTQIKNDEWDVEQDRCFEVVYEIMSNSKHVISKREKEL